jgi:rod shape-determining protein MreD
VKVAIPLGWGIAAALIDASVAPHFGFGGGHPHLVLVLVVVSAVADELETTLFCAVGGGIVLDVLTARPLGGTAFALLIVLAGARPAARTPTRIRTLLAICLTPLASAMYSLVVIAILGLLDVALLGPTFARLLPGMGYDTAIASLAATSAAQVARRRAAVTAFA